MQQKEQKVNRCDEMCDGFVVLSCLRLFWEISLVIKKKKIKSHSLLFKTRLRLPPHPQNMGARVPGPRALTAWSGLLLPLHSHQSHLVHSAPVLPPLHHAADSWVSEMQCFSSDFKKSGSQPIPTIQKWLDTSAFKVLNCMLYIKHLLYFLTVTLNLFSNLTAVIKVYQ